MPSPQIYVVFYRPRYGNYRHWALYLQSDAGHVIFEVTGSHPNFKKNEVKANPQDSGSYLGKQYVGVISDKDIPAVRKAVAEVKVDNETTEWDCQEYVIDILDKLEEELILEEDDEDYKEARKALRKKRGATV
ncbi:hypothetical protein DV736_g6298, partial [Chaetothyriales sp. CBS 134916]